MFVNAAASYEIIVVVPDAKCLGKAVRYSRPPERQGECAAFANTV